MDAAWVTLLLSMREVPGFSPSPVLVDSEDQDQASLSVQCGSRNGPFKIQTFITHLSHNLLENNF